MFTITFQNIALSIKLNDKLEIIKNSDFNDKLQLKIFHL